MKIEMEMKMKIALNLITLKLLLHQINFANQKSSPERIIKSTIALLYRKKGEEEEGEDYSMVKDGDGERGNSSLSLSIHN